MTAQIFRDDEDSYLGWIKKNRGGYVLTTSRAAPASYMSLHRASCSLISSYMSNMKHGAFTERNYFKVCSTDADSLRAWLSLKGGKDFTNLCSRCRPDVAASPNYFVGSTTFESLVAKSLRDSKEERDARLRNAAKRPSCSVVSTLVFQRNPDVVAAVLERAQGICEECNKPAPFRRRSDSTPYLEVHHRIRLADGGEDTVPNAIALCPNCHRYLHYGRADG